LLIQAGYVEELKQHRLPEAMKPLALQLLFKPDKNTIEYKALAEACDALQMSASRLMLATGGIRSPKELHLAKFYFEHFPKVWVFRRLRYRPYRPIYRSPMCRHFLSMT
jgi:exoribonuclease-2